MVAALSSYGQYDVPACALQRDTGSSRCATSAAGRLDVQNADQALAEAWDNSAAAREELGEQPGMIRRAIGLGRSLLDPLPVLAALCGASSDPPRSQNRSRKTL